jgi:hypothetical protein
MVTVPPVTGVLIRRAFLELEKVTRESFRFQNAE